MKLGFMSKGGLRIQCKSAINKFMVDNPGTDKLIVEAKAALVFPSVIKVGMGLGGEYGEGGIMLDTETTKVDHLYSLISVSYGFQLGAQKRTIIMLFMTDDALKQFNKTKGWKVGVDASVTVLEADAGINIDTNTLTSPVVAFVTDRKGLMYSASLEGTKITRMPD